MFHTAKLSISHGFTKGVSVDVSYLKINDVFDFTCNQGPMILSCLSQAKIMLIGDNVVGRKCGDGH